VNLLESNIPEEAESKFFSTLHTGLNRYGKKVGSLILSFGPTHCVGKSYALGFYVCILHYEIT